MKKIDLVLPSRIGDSILSIPAIVCLEQLNRKFNNGYSIRVLSKPFLVELFSSLGLFNFKGMGFPEKARSFFNPADKAFFVETTNDNLGYFAKESYGIENPFKKFLKFTHQPEYLTFSAQQDLLVLENARKALPTELVDFLSEKHKLSLYPIALFGICLDLGYTAEQIIETFDWSEDLVNCRNLATPHQVRGDNGNYVVFCVEAGYGRKHLDARCWDINGYFEIARKCAQDFGVKAVFIGMDTKMPLPDEEHIIDLRGKVSIKELAGVMKQAKCYIGNDTGPAHLANLMRTRSVAVYMKEETIKGFSPVFSGLCTHLLRPDSIEVFYKEVQKVLNIPVGGIYK